MAWSCGGRARAKGREVYVYFKEPNRKEKQHGRAKGLGRKWGGMVMPFTTFVYTKSLEYFQVAQGWHGRARRHCLAVPNFWVLRT